MKQRIGILIVGFLVMVALFLGIVLLTLTLDNGSDETALKPDAVFSISYMDIYAVCNDTTGFFVAYDQNDAIAMLRMEESEFTEHCIYGTP